MDRKRLLGTLTGLPMTRARRFFGLCTAFLACLAIGVARADYPLRLYDGPWNEDFQEWWDDADNAFRWTTGSITTANQFLRSEVKLTRSMAPFVIHYDHLVESDLIGHATYDPYAPHSDYGVFRVDWFGPLAPYYLSALIHMNYYKSYGAGGIGLGRTLPNGGDAQFYVVGRPMADFIAAEEALGNPAHTIRYPTMPFDLYAQVHERIGSTIDTRFETAFSREQWVENEPDAYPPLLDQPFEMQNFAAKLKTWWDTGVWGLVTRTLLEYRSESFTPLGLYRTRFSPNVHFGQGSPWYAEILLRKDAGNWREELRGHAGFLQWASTEYTADRRDSAGTSLRLEYRFAWWGSFSVQGDYEKGYGQYPQDPIYDHAEQLNLALSERWRARVEGSYYLQAGSARRITWNLTRYEILWLF